MNITENEKQAITKFAVALADELEMWTQPDDYEYWSSWGDDIDINIFKYGSDKLQCTIYPVVDGNIITNQMVSIDLTEGNK